VVDGIAYEKTDASPFWDENNLIARALVDNEIKLDINFGEANTETLDINVTAESFATLEEEVVIQVVCVERSITQINGENGETFFDWVVRKMLPDAAGTSFSNGITENEIVDVNVSWKPENIFDPNNMVVIAFAQNNITKEIYNVVMKTPSYFPDIVAGLADQVFANSNFPVIYPNPVNEVLNIALDTRLANDLDLEIVTVEGKTVQSGYISKGQNSLQIEVSSLPRGTYFIKYHMAGEFVLGQKFIKR
jgi:hypothetical protein